MDNQLKVGAQNKIKKLLFGPLQLCLSAHVLHFFSNYAEHINDIRHILFLCFEHQIIQKKLFHEPFPWDVTSKYKHKINK